MKKLLLIITVILTSVSSAWADGITAGTFQIAEATTGKIVTNGSQFGPQNWSSYVGIAENANTSWKIEASGNYFIIKPTDNNNNYLGAGNENSRNEQDIAFNDIGSAQEYRFDDAGDNTYYIYNVTKGRWMCLNSYNSNTQLGFNDNQSNRAKFRLLPGFVSIDPVNLTSGWYQIKWHDNNGATGTNIMSDVQGKYIKNHQEEVTVGNDKHSIYLDTHSSRQVNDIVTTFVYLDVKEQTKPNSDANANPNGCRAILRGLNGHSISYTGAISQTDVNVYPIRVGGSGEQLLRCTLTSSATSGSDRQTMIPMDNGNTKYMGNVTNKYPYAYWSKVDVSSCGLQPWTVKFVTQTDITVEYTGSSNYGIDKVYDGGTFFFDTDIVPDASDFTCNPGTGENTPYYNPGILIDTEDKTITVLPYPNRDIDVPSGYNGYIGGKTTIGETEWKTKEYWSLTDTWNDAGSGCTPTSGDGMWSPIYLKDITGGTVPTLDGWNFRMIADHSTYEIASVGKIQGGMDCYFTLKNTSVVTMNFGTGHTFNFAINLNEGTGNILNFVMSNGYNHYNKWTCSKDCSGQITVNYGNVSKNTNRVFNASGTGTINKLILNATFTEPAEYNNVEEITLVTFSNVSASTITTTNLTPVGDGWTPVNNKAELETQTTPGKYYFIEKITNTGVILHTYMQRAYTVGDNTKFSEIYYDRFFNDYMYIYIPSGKKLTIDTNIDNLANSPIIKAESNTSVIQINEGITLYSANIIDSQTPKIIGAGTFKTTTYTASVPLNVTLGTDWTGIVSRANATVGGAFYFDNLVNSTNSKVQVTSVTGWIEGNSTTNANIILINGANNYGFCVNGTNDNNSYRFTGKIQGTGNFTYDQSNQEGYNRSPIYYFSGDLSDWTGKFILKENGTGTTTVNVTSTGNINAGFQNSSTKSNTLKLTFESSSQQNINGNITNSGSGTLNMILSGTGSKTIGANVTANNLTIINSNGAEITISGNRTINVVNLYAYIDNNNTLSPLNINMNTDDIATKLGEDESCTLISVTGSYTASSLTINGKENVTVGDYDYYISYNDNAITLSRRYYSRNVTSGNFGSICLPNGAKVSQMTGVAKVLKVTDVTTDRVVMDEVKEMTPGVPYIFKSNASAINLTLKGATEANPVDDPEDYLVGNFSPVTVPTSDQNTSYYVLQSNKFKKVTSASSITSGSNRCYLKVPVTPSSSRQAILGIDIDEDSATGIDAINSLINNNAEIYDINGRKLKDLRKGINIVNGVKVIVK